MTTGQINSENEKPFKFKRDEYSTIEELKEAYARNKGGVLDAYDFQFALNPKNPKNPKNTEILGNNVPLKACLELQLIRTSWELLKGEVIIHAIRRPQLCAERLREIDSTNSIHDLEEKLVKLEEILRKPINREGEKTMLAREDRDIVLAAVQKDGRALSYATKELNNNPHILIEAVQQNGLALAYASRELRANSGLVLTAMKQNVYALEFAPPELKADKEFMLIAVQLNGYALRYASDRLKNNSEIVLAAVKQNGIALQFASKELMGKQSSLSPIKITAKNIVLAAVQQNGEALLYAPEAFKTDSEIVLAAEKQNQRPLQGVPQELTTNKNLRNRIFNGFTSPMINFKKRITGAPSGPANDTPKTPLLGENKTNPNINAPPI
jgi:hypothetical protein